ncbi:MAG: hypothetical protein OEN02_11125 [Gammaproteobacteria bacterium]|nr:hypothetical protein [Gammaproteobacteria bacterium]MDH3535186.1 hypothetical protein [Gammaproteobacteria bacterium]
MKLFDVSVLGLKKIYDMPGTWCEADYRNLLRELEVDEVDDMSGGDLLDILLMALQDLEPEDAGELVLAYKLKTRVSKGSRQNIVQDLLEGQRAWEETADIYLHADIFAACVLLQQAFPKIFAQPDMLQLRLQLVAVGAPGKAILGEEPEASFVARVLADGMSEKSILERLFDEQLVSNSFPEAEGIVWLAEFGERSADGKSALLTVYSSEHWLDSMEDVGDFPSSAYNDRPDEDDED